MSLLLKDEIDEGVKNGTIIIRPYNKSQLGPNSYDVRLGDILLVYAEEILDVKKKNRTKTIVIPLSGFVLQPGELYLGSTVEKAGSDHYIPGYDGRSSSARLGIGSHISAGFGDIGFKSNWTLEITVVKPTRIYSGMRIGQVYFKTVNKEFNHLTNRYTGKYTDQVKPQASKSHIDFN